MVSWAVWCWRVLIGRLVVVPVHSWGRLSVAGRALVLLLGLLLLVVVVQGLLGQQGLPMKAKS